MKKVLRFLGLCLLVAAVLLAGLATTLRLQDRLLFQRFTSFFVAEDLNYANLSPREAVAPGQQVALPVAQPGQQSIAGNALSAMQSYAQAQGSHALVVLHKGQIQLEWYKQGWSRDRLTQSQSMHKSLQPLLIHRAIERGLINGLDEPVENYIQEWRGDPRGKITIEQLLQMSSGLRSTAFSLNPFSRDFRWLFASNVTPVLLETPVEQPAGLSFDYNDINSELLGLVLERASGQRYASFLSENLWQPLGAGEAWVWLDQAAGKAHTSCCLLARPVDWARLGAMLMNQGRINGQQLIDADFIDRMIAASPVSNWYGYQIWLGYSDSLNPRAVLRGGGYQRTAPFKAQDTFYLSGYGAQRVYVVPSKQLVIVRLGPASGRSPVKPSWDNSYLVNTAIDGIRDL